MNDWVKTKQWLIDRGITSVLRHPWLWLAGLTLYVAGVTYLFIRGW